MRSGYGLGRGRMGGVGEVWLFRFVLGFKGELYICIL